MSATVPLLTDQHGTGQAKSRRLPAVIALMILLVTLVAAGGLLAGMRLAAGPPPAPSADSIDAGFARDMQAHHNQAVQMSLLVLDRSQDAEVRTLARDILLTQQQQAGQMYAWLAQWNLPQSSAGPAMAWMPGAGGMAGMDDGRAPSSGDEQAAATSTPGMASMPGMASSKDLDRLRQATGGEADRLYLQLMIPHHQGAVVMAEVAAAQAGVPAVRRLARTIVDSQTAELTVLKRTLTARGGALDGP